MKKKLSYIAVLLSIWTATSCTDEVIINEQPQELRVTAGVDGQSRVTFVDGNGVTKTHWKTNDKIGLYTYKAQSGDYSLFIAAFFLLLFVFSPKTRRLWGYYSLIS